MPVIAQRSFNRQAAAGTLRMDRVALRLVTEGSGMKFLFQAGRGVAEACAFSMKALRERRHLRSRTSSHLSRVFLTFHTTSNFLR
jgi:hypothetical protein